MRYLPKEQPRCNTSPASALAAILAAGLLGQPARAATRTWDGNGASNNWGYVNSASPFNTNWTDDATSAASLLPANNDSLVFAGTTQLANTNNLSNLSIAGIAFNAGAGAFTLGGNAITSTGNLSSALQTLGLPITVGSTQSWDGGTAGMTVSGAVTLGNHALTLSNGTALANSASNFTVGDSGTALLVLQSGSSVSDVIGTLGNVGSGIGSATLDGAGTAWTNSDKFYAGLSGDGTLAIQNGAHLNYANGYIGYFGTSDSTATVTGAGSQWVNSADIKIGIVGKGTLNILNGGLVQDSTGYIGYSGGGLGGTVTVGGTGSTWSNSHDLVVGLNSAATLNVNTGGTASAGNLLSIGSAGVLNLSGGTLQAASASKNAGGQFNWTAGTLKLDSTTLGDTTSLLGTSVNLGNGQTLDVGTLTVNVGGTLALTAADRITDTTALVLNGGSFNLNNNAETLASLAGTSGAVNLGSAKLTVGGSNADTSYAGTITGSSSSQLYKTGTGNLTLTGTSTMDYSLIHQGSLLLSGGGQLHNNVNAGVGDSSGNATAIVDGTNSLWSISGSLYVGTQSYSSGALTIQNGGSVSSAGGYVDYGGSVYSSDGTVTVTGPGSSWNTVQGVLSIGRNVGNGTLKIENGATMLSSTTILGDNYGTANGTATVKGPSSWEIDFGDFFIGQRGHGTLNVLYGGTMLSTWGTTYLGYSGVNGSRGIGAATVAGADSTLNTSALYVGYSGDGTLNIGDGGYVSSSTGYLGYNVGGTGSATVTGANSSWYIVHSLHVGNAGSGTLTIDNGGAVAVGDLLSIGSLGVLNLNGGTLQAPTLTNTGSIQLAGGTLVATTLNNNGGSISGSALDLGTIGTFSGFGTVSSAINGGTAANTIQASGGNLALGDASTTAGFNFGGVLNVGSHQIELKDQDQAQLGVATSLGNGGLLRADNGINLSGGETLSYSGNASVQGGFTNNGQVSGSGGALTFLDNVNGAGGFTGSINFQAGYSPGNSPAAVDFGGGDATFGTNSALNMEIFGGTPGTQYDRLFNIDTLSFNGTLNLVFGNGYAPVAGSSFDLFDFALFSGLFDPAKITVAGFDRSLLDFSRLSVDGKLAVTAAPVPLPAAAWLFGSALAGFTAFGRRRRTA